MDEFREVTKMIMSEIDKDINVPNKNDSISRQAAIDALDKRFDSIPMEQTTEILQLRRDLRHLPSAQSEIVRCKDCKHYDGEPCGIVDWYNTADDFCSRAERRTYG